MRMFSVLSVGAAVVGMTLAVPTTVAAEAGDPGEPQAVVWVDGYTLFGGPQDQMLSGQGWAEGELIDFRVNGELVAEDVVAEPNAEGSYTPAYFPTDRILPGDVVQLAGDRSGTRQHEVTTLTVTDVNAGVDRVTGTADPNAQVTVVVARFAAVQVVAADSAGNWTADFSNVAMEDASVGAIGPGTRGFAIQFDADDDAGDVTVVGWASSGLAPLPSNFEQFPGGWDDGAWVDFGFGETSYRSCPELDGDERVCPAVEWKLDEKTAPNRSTVKAIVKLSDVRYVKQDSGAEGPEYFDVIYGIFVNKVSFDGNGSLVSFTGSWSWQIQTDVGDIYQATGQIRDFDDGQAPWDFQRWSGPIIEP